MLLVASSAMAETECYQVMLLLNRVIAMLLIVSVICEVSNTAKASFFSSSIEGYPVMLNM